MVAELPVLAGCDNGRKINVAFFADILTAEMDGAIRTMYQLINRIDCDRFSFLFIYGAGPDEIKNFQSLKIPAVSIFITTGYSIALPALAQKNITDTLNHFAPDVVHIATPSLLGNFALNYATSLGLPVLAIYHTHFISYIDYYFKHTPFLIESARQLVAQNHKAFYNKCSKVYVPSKRIRAELEKIGIHSERMQIWKRGIDSSLFTPAKKNKAALQKLTGNTHPTVLFVSRLVWEKNLETLFLIYDELQEADIPANLVIAGDGSALKACKARMPGAIFTGNISHNNLATLYASSDVFLFPSVSEACGNVVLEAMASGLPCVIADGGGSSDFINQGVNGFKCNPYNAADYAEKVSQILESDSLGNKFSEAGLHYSRTFSWNELADTYFADLTKLVRHRREMVLVG